MCAINSLIMENCEMKQERIETDDLDFDSVVEGIRNGSNSRREKKRERSSNFSDRELEILASLIVKYKNILESKKNDGCSWKEKEQAWLNIQNEFNRTSDHQVYRPWKNLRTKYDCMKKEMRKKIATIQNSFEGTNLCRWEEKLMPVLNVNWESVKEFDRDDLDDPLQTACPTLPKRTSELVKPCTPIAHEQNNGKSKKGATCDDVERFIHFLYPDSCATQLGEEIAGDCESIFKKRKTNRTLAAQGINSVLDEISLRKQQLLSCQIHEYKISAAKKMKLLDLQIEDVQGQIQERVLRVEVLKEQEKQEKIKTRLLELQLERVLSERK